MLAKIVAVLALSAGLTLGVTTTGDTPPTEASTAHSIAYHCSITKPAGSTLIGAWAWTVINGVVMVDKCRADLAGWNADRCWTVYETTHNRSGYYVC